MNRKPCYLWLSAPKDEKDKIAKTLLEKKLIACAKFIPVESAYWWQGKIEQDNEVVIVMESFEDLYEQIELEVSKIHSYETFVLQMVSVTKINNDALKWMKSVIK